MGEAKPRARADHLGPERRRPQVLDAAKAIALVSGIPAVTIGAIAAKLGVTRPVVYACYGNRVELIDELLAREEKRLLDGLLAAYPAPGAHTSTEDAYVGGMRALMRFVDENPGTWRTVFDSGGQERSDPGLEAGPAHDVADLVARGRRRVAAQFALLVRPDLERWGMTDLERKLPVIVDQFVSMAESGVRSLLAPDNSYTPDEMGEHVGRAVYRAIRGF